MSKCHHRRGHGAAETDAAATRTTAFVECSNRSRLPYEASRAVVAVAAARRDADWREAAQANRRRALVALGAPLVVGVVLMALGALAFPLLIVGAVVTIRWAVTAVRIWRRPAAGILTPSAGSALTRVWPGG